jgi:trehalose-6-phosphatase
MNTKQMRRMNTIFYALLAQAAAVHGAAVKAPVATTSSSAKQETDADKQVRDTVAVV